MSTVSAHREAMISALKAHLIPYLKTNGFRGSFPHFRREALPRVDYLTVQFSRDGGSFVVELATSSDDGRPSGHGSELPVSKLTTHYFRDRHRLGSGLAAGASDHWFRFGPSAFDRPIPVHEEGYYADIANAVRKSFEQDGAKWLESRHGAA